MGQIPHPTSIIDLAFGILKRRFWPMVFTFCLIFLTGAAVLVALPPFYSASTTLLFGQEDISDSLVGTNYGSALGQRLDVARQALLSSAQLMEVIEKHDLYQEMRKSLPREVTVQQMRNDVSIEQGVLRQPVYGQESNYSLTISYQGWDPELVANVANDLAERFGNESRDLTRNQLTATTEFLEQQLQTAESRFERQQDLINEYQQEHLGRLPQQVSLNMSNLESLNSALRLNNEKQISLETRFDDIRLGQASSRIGGAPVSGEQRIDKLKGDLADLRARYTESYPGIIHLKTEISQLEAKLAETAGREPSGGVNITIENNDSVSLEGRRQLAEIEQQLETLKVEEMNLKADIRDIQDRIQLLPAIDQELKRLTNNYNAAREDYLEMSKKYRDSVLAENLESQTGQQFQVLEPATPPNFSKAPQTTILLMVVMVLAGGFAAGIALVLEFFDKTFHNLNDIRAFTNLPVLVSVAHINTRKEIAAKWLRFLLVALISITLIGSSVIVANSYAENNGQNLIRLMG